MPICELKGKEYGKLSITWYNHLELHQQLQVFCNTTRLALHIYRLKFLPAILCKVALLLLFDLVGQNVPN